MIYTIGHSAYSQAEFIELLRLHRIRTIVDIRTHPMSKWAHFNMSEMADPDGWLATAGIRYEWCAPLSGWHRRHAQDPGLLAAMNEVGVNLATYDVAFYPKTLLRSRVGVAPWRWRHEFDFAWYTALPQFQTESCKLMQRVTRGQIGQPALMCSEYDWQQCHRAQVADFISHNHGGVVHISGNHQEPHDRHFLSRLENYDKRIVSSWRWRT